MLWTRYWSTDLNLQSNIHQLVQDANAADAAAPPAETEEPPLQDEADNVAGAATPKETEEPAMPVEALLLLAATAIGQTAATSSALAPAPAPAPSAPSAPSAPATGIETLSGAPAGPSRIRQPMLVPKRQDTNVRTTIGAGVRKISDLREELVSQKAAKRAVGHQKSQTSAKYDEGQHYGGDRTTERAAVC
jgi:hypothetical protein